MINQLFDVNIIVYKANIASAIIAPHQIGEQMHKSLHLLQNQQKRKSVKT